MLNIALLGAGLHNLLLTLWLQEKVSGTERATSENFLWIEIFERETEIPTGRTISAHESDIPVAMRSFLGRYICNRWNSYTVAFGRSRRSVPIGYLTLNLEQIRADVRALEREGQIALHFGQSVHPHHLPKSVSGEPFQICCDSTGVTKKQQPVAGTPLTAQVSDDFQGVQQFYGRTYRYPNHHGFTEPVIMDARVPQPEKNGFRFIYLLPCTGEHLLVEDTRLIPAPVEMATLADCVKPSLPQELELQTQSGHGSPGASVAASPDPDHSDDHQTVSITHEESGRIPIPLHAWNSINFAEEQPLGPEAHCTVIPVGLKAGYFNPTTGYSLPHALRSVQALKHDIWQHLHQPRAEQNAKKPFHSFPAFSAFARSTRASWPAYRLFNLLLFYGFPPGKASHAFDYFYALPVSFVQKFYSGQLRLPNLWIFLLRPAPRSFLFRRIPLIVSSFLSRRVKRNAQCLDG